MTVSVQNQFEFECFSEDSSYKSFLVAGRRKCSLVTPYLELEATMLLYVSRYTSTAWYLGIRITQLVQDERSGFDSRQMGKIFLRTDLEFTQPVATGVKDAGA